MHVEPLHAAVWRWLDVLQPVVDGIGHDPGGDGVDDATGAVHQVHHPPFDRGDHGPDVVDLADEVRQDPAYFRGAGQDGFRDGCRVPIPWTREGSSYGFGVGGSWLPQPAEWAELSIEAQTGTPGSTLELYRAALTARREHPGLGAGDCVEWLKAPQGVLAFRRGEFVCVANTSGEAVTIPAYGEVLVASGEVTVVEEEAKLPADTTVWWTTG